MKKVSIKNLIEFRRRPVKSKLSFLNSIMKDKLAQEKGKGGGDYWVSCLSAICHVFHDLDKKPIDDKITDLQERIENTKHRGTKSRWQKNIDILHGFEDFDFRSLRPEAVQFIKKAESLSTIRINDLPIESKPHFVYSFENKGQTEIGAVWFIAKKDGYKKDELGLFADTMYRYLLLNYADEYRVSSVYCTAVDLVNGREVKYSQLEGGEVSRLLEQTVVEIQALLK